MIDIQTIRDEIQQWIEETLSVPNELFNGMKPCPYALTAWQTQKVHVHVGDISLDEIGELLKTKEVVICAYDRSLIDVDTLSEKAEEINTQLDELVALEDHPDFKEQVGSLILNQGTYALLLIQRRDKLETARRYLHEKKYYEHWNPDYYSDVLDR